MFLSNKNLNFFPLIMSTLIIATLFTFRSIENKRRFIQNSETTLIVLERDLENTKGVEKNLERLTYQNVEIESFGGVTYVKIKCPPDRTPFFKKLIQDLTE